MFTLRSIFTRTASKNPSPTLRTVWTRTVFKLVVVIMGLGVTALTFTQYQRSAFERTTSRSETEMGALVALDRTLLHVDDPIGAVLYKFGGPSASAKSLGTYREASGAIDHSFDQAAAALPPGKGLDLLRKARTSWDIVDAAVVAGAKMSGEDLGKSLAAGKDPFQATAWAPLRVTNATLTDVRADTMDALQQRAEGINRVQRLIGPLVLGVLMLALGLAWAASRRIARQVLVPLANLRRAAADMHDEEFDLTGRLGGAVAEIQELAVTLDATATSIRKSHGKLREQANSDLLSGLPNRKAFTERLHAKVNEPVHGRVAVLFIDLDDFKVVNDSLGHAAGDELLRIVSRRLHSATRGCEMVARLGGDEFAVVLEDASQPSTAIAVAERILAALDEPATIDGTSIPVGCSIGIAISDGGAGDDAADELVRNADFAMYMAKSQGKNRFEVFASAMHTEMLARMELKRDLGQALRLEQLELFYQPVVHIASGDVLGFEGLIRWRHPARGLLLPGEFIGLAEDTGDIVAIGAWVIEQGCQDLAARQQRNADGIPAWVSVNVSGKQLDGSLVETVQDALQRHNVAPGSLVLEITEGIALTNTSAACDELAELRRLGVHVALDDFGTGFSSLRSLDELPIDIIKIDRSFVTQQGNAGGAMLDAIVTLGRSLGLQMIAEGIEQPGELERLRSLGVPCGQGYLFARPMPASEAASFCRGGSDPSADDELAMRA